jgi:hypothetical protein
VVLLFTGFFLALAVAVNSHKFPASRFTCVNIRDAASTSLTEAEDLRVLPGASRMTIPKLASQASRGQFKIQYQHSHCCKFSEVENLLTLVLHIIMVH